jgi:hypothetical protein
MHVEDIGVFVDLALGSWCLFYASQPPIMRSTSLALIYGWLLHFGATRATWRVCCTSFEGGYTLELELG